MSERHLRLLLVEDSTDDADLIVRALKRGGYTLEVECVENEATLRATSAIDAFDLAITDHIFPTGFDSTRVLEILHERAPDLPCLLVSGSVGEEAVGRAMRLGAVDYVGKDNLGRLATSVERTLSESRRRRDRQLAEEAIARSGRLFEAVFVNAGDAMLILDDERRLIDVNPAAAALLAMPRDKLLELRAEDLMPDAFRSDAPAVWAEFLGAAKRHGEVELLRADGDLVAAEFTAVAHFLSGRHIVIMRDIRERRAAEAELERRFAQQEAVAELGELALREGDLDRLMEAAAGRVAKTLGAQIAGVMELRANERAFVLKAGVGLGATLNGRSIPHESGASSQADYTVSQEDPVLVEDYEDETRFDRVPMFKERGVRSAISVRIPGDQRPYGVLGAASELTRAFTTVDARFLTAVAHTLAAAVRRIRSEEETRRRALHDAMTGLPNRTLFSDRLVQALARTKRTGTRLAVLFLDVDRFKAFNDTLGHRAGDRLLIQVGVRIEEIMRESDTVSRFGGDEFVVLCDHLDGEAEATGLVTRLVSAFEKPFTLDGERHQLTASIGVAVSDADNLDGEALLRDADIAMYR